MSNSKMKSSEIKSTCMAFPKRTVSAGQSALFISSVKWVTETEGIISITFEENCFYSSEERSVNGYCQDANCVVSNTGRSSWSNMGSESDSCIPSMNLTWCDPPLEDFVWNEKTFKYDDFSDAFRGGVSNWPVMIENGPNNGMTFEEYRPGVYTHPDWSPGAVVLHEFGHALGMLHEHQNNIKKDGSVVEFNTEQIYRDFEAQGLSREDADHNILNRYSNTDPGLEGSSFDNESIMLYDFLDSWIVGGSLNNPTKENFRLSETDKQWLQKAYPESGTSRPKITVVYLNGYEWQQAWVSKVVKDMLEPYVGVEFFFESMSIDELKDREEREDKVGKIIADFFKDLKDPKVIATIVVLSLFGLFVLYQLFRPRSRK